MVNSVKQFGSGLALQVTREARDAGLVEENADGDATRLADVFVYGFDGLLLVFDAERVSTSERAALVATATTVTNSIHRGEATELVVRGNGYQVQLLGCKSAGFREGDDAPVTTAPGLLVIHDGTNGRLANDLTTSRVEQRAD